MSAEGQRRYRARHPERVREIQANDWAKNRARRTQESLVARAGKLLRGEQVRDKAGHHKAMAYLKGPRPEGMELSLVNYDSPDAYWGRHTVGGQRIDYRLSTSPDDYAWETRADNLARMK
jgi:hypothetical protein